MKKRICAAVLAGCLLLAGALTGCTQGEPMETQPPETTAPVQNVPTFTVDTSVPEGQGIKLNALVGDNSVWQQNEDVKLWGTCDSDGPIAVDVNGQFFYGEVKNGAFELFVHTGAASKTNSITVYTETEKKTVAGVWFGEVFLMAGQSNMQFLLIEMSTVPDNVPRDVRSLTVPVLQYDAPVTEPQQEAANLSWVSIGDAVPNVSAVGYYFAEMMAQELDCPIGIVCNAAGDTIVVSWLPNEKAAEMPPVYQEVRNDKWWVRTPSHAYNTLLSPILNGTFKSVIWYQGENQSYQYDVFLTEMISCWREAFGQRDLPFTIIEIVGCGDSWIQSWPEIREMQRKVAETVPNCTISVGIDLGEKLNVHPSDKEPVGHRAAWATLNALYGGNYPDAPVIEKVEKKDNSICLSFTNDAGLNIKDETAAAFEVSPDGRAWYPATAAMDGTTVVLTWQEGLTPTHVRYAWANFSPDLAVLFNGDGMPADSFMAELK